MWKLNVNCKQEWKDTNRAKLMLTLIRCYTWGRQDIAWGRDIIHHCYISENTNIACMQYKTFTVYQLYIAYLCYAFEGHILHLTRHLWLPRMALGPNIIFHHRREMLRAIRCRILMFEIFQFTRRKIWKGSSDWYKWLKGAVKNVFWESFPKCMNPPTLSGPLTHPRVLWDLGKRKVKFR